MNKLYENYTLDLVFRFASVRPSFLTFESGEAGVDVGCEAEDGGGVDEGFTHVGHDGVGEFSNGRNDEGRDVECYA